MPSYSKSNDLCISCVHIVNNNEPVNCISYSGGDWVLLCGRNHHYSDDEKISNDTEELITIHHHHLTEKDESLVEIMDKLSIDYTAERKDKYSEWKIYHDPDEF